MKLSIVIPTYNETEGILIFLKKLKQVLVKLDKEYKPEIIIVDDNSPDLTPKKIKGKYKNDKSVRIVVRKKVKGLGTAIGYGVKKAKGGIICGLDADGNHDVKKIPLMLRTLKTSDLVVASRFIKGGGAEGFFDKFRHLGSFVLNFILKFFLGSPVWDSTSGFYAINTNKLRALGLDKIYYGYGDYHLRLVYFAKNKNYLIKEIPYIYKKRIAGQSKSRLFKMFFDYFIEGIRLCLSKNG